MAEEEVVAAVAVELRYADMPEKMCKFVFEKASEALEEKKIEKDIATFVKKSVELEYAGTWHCVVGKNYGVSVTNETHYIVFFKIGLMNFLVFQSLDEEIKPETLDTGLHGLKRK